MRKLTLCRVFSRFAWRCSFIDFPLRRVFMNHLQHGAGCSLSPLRKEKRFPGEELETSHAQRVCTISSSGVSVLLFIYTPVSPHLELEASLFHLYTPGIGA